MILWSICILILRKLYPSSYSNFRMQNLQKCLVRHFLLFYVAHESGRVGEMQRLVAFTFTGTKVLLILGRAASSFLITFLSSFVGPSVIRLSRRMAFFITFLSSFVGPSVIRLSQRNKNSCSDRSCVS